METAMADTPTQHRRRQRPSTARTSQTPSYASPTVSSSAKSNPTEFLNSPSTPSKSQKHPSTRRAFKTYCLSTEASRRKSRQPAPFGFLDLPGDIRNIIYDYIAGDCIGSSSQVWPIRYASPKAIPTYAGRPAGYWPFRRPYNRRLPPLFLVKSKQIREEFGGYIFTQRHILLVSLTKQGLAGLFQSIGFVNCKRLVRNDDACLQVWHNVPISVDRRPTLTFYHPLSWANVSALVDGEALWKCGRPEEVEED